MIIAKYSDNSWYSCQTRKLANKKEDCPALNSSLMNARQQLKSVNTSQESYSFRHKGVKEGCVVYAPE